jgi:hypothetical protein
VQGGFNELYITVKPLPATAQPTALFPGEGIKNITLLNADNSSKLL